MVGESPLHSGFPAIWELERYRPDLARLKKPTVLSTVFAVRIANGAAVFLIVALVTAAWARVVGQEQAPTQGSDTEALTVCKLLANAKDYAGKTVTLKAAFVANFEFSALTDSSCQPRPTDVDGKHPLIAPHFDAASYNPKSPLAKRLNKLLKKENQAKVCL